AGQTSLTVRSRQRTRAERRAQPGIAERHEDVSDGAAARPLAAPALFPQRRRGYARGGRGALRLTPRTAPHPRTEVGPRAVSKNVVAKRSRVGASPSLQLPPVPQQVTDRVLEEHLGIVLRPPAETGNVNARTSSSPALRRGSTVDSVNLIP